MLRHREQLLRHHRSHLGEGDLLGSNEPAVILPIGGKRKIRYRNAARAYYVALNFAHL
jgi:hypothetical protein